MTVTNPFPEGGLINLLSSLETASFATSLRFIYEVPDPIRSVSLRTFCEFSHPSAAT